MFIVIERLRFAIIMATHSILRATMPGKNRNVEK